MNGEWPFVSVIIPTYNRSSLLRQTVETFVAQTYPADRWELILVDNHSTDNTWSVIQALAVREDRIRPLRELRKGAHYARNSGAMQSRGSILYFTDDDMLAEPDLLANIVGVFDVDDRVASVTGKVLPRWDTEPPAWVLEHLRNALLSLNDLGEATMITDEDPGVFSCHQAVRRDAFIEAGGFNPDTNAGLFTGDNETGLNIKLRKRGYRFAYVGTAVTRHMIPASRMTQQYLNRRMADQGFCDSYTDYRSIRPGKGRLAKRIVAHSALIGVAALKAAARRAVGDTRWRLDLARIWYHRNRAVYDVRLLSDEHWRNFALRDNWLTDTAQAKQ
ncbi:MAG: glycosyltransferase [Gemmatimonadaceae bacterium]